MQSFATLSRPITISGIGLHTGDITHVRLKSAADVGIRFIRVDRDNIQVPANYKCIKSTFHATLLAKDDVEISTPEHLLAALWGMGITHCDVEIDGAEVPILDGSAADWCDVIADAGITTIESTFRPVWKLTQCVRVENHGAMVLAVPYSGLRLTVAVDFDVDYLSQQLIDVEFPQTSFAKDIAPARTFALAEWEKPLRAQGLIRGGSTDNALVLDKDSPRSPLRFPEELARHKTMDALGDFALLTAQTGAILQAHFILIRAGHSLHSQWMQAAATENYWQKTPDFSAKK